MVKRLVIRYHTAMKRLVIRYHTAMKRLVIRNHSAMERLVIRNHTVMQARGKFQSKSTATMPQSRLYHWTTKLAMLHKGYQEMVAVVQQTGQMVAIGQSVTKAHGQHHAAKIMLKP